MKVKAVLLDVDGTLLNTYDFIFNALKYAITLHGHPAPSDENIKKAMGKPLLKFYQVLYPKGNHEILARTHKQFQKGKFDLAKSFPNTEKTLKSLKESGILLAAISNRTKKSLMTSLKRAKLLKFIDLVVSTEDVKHPKPHKEHIMFALNYLEVGPKEAFMVGDTPDDILAGKNAKVKTIGATYGFLGKEIKKYEPDFLINSIEELLKILA